jgi:hypothetical protein
MGGRRSTKTATHACSATSPPTTRRVRALGGHQTVGSKEQADVRVDDGGLGDDDQDGLWASSTF